MIFKDYNSSSQKNPCTWIHGRSINIPPIVSTAPQFSLLPPFGSPGIQSVKPVLFKGSPNTVIHDPSSLSSVIPMKLA